MRAEKPGWVFDREREWQGLVAFAADPARHATLGVVSGRRRQGKSYLLQAARTPGSILLVDPEMLYPA